MCVVCLYIFILLGEPICKTLSQLRGNVRFAGGEGREEDKNQIKNHATIMSAILWVGTSKST